MKKALIGLTKTVSLMTSTLHLIALLSGLVLYSMPLQAKELVVAFPASLPPWTLQGKNVGITLDIVREALDYRGHTIQPIYLPLGELNKGMSEEADVHAQVESTKMEGHYSIKVTTFSTSLISLASNRFSISSIEDLSSKSIVAFQNAAWLFGDKFQAMCHNNTRYIETYDQQAQVALLLSGNIEAILIDRNTFQYYKKNIRSNKKAKEVTFHNIDGLTVPSPAYLVFKDKKIRDDFNAGLNLLNAEREILHKIYRRYLD